MKQLDEKGMTSVFQKEHRGQCSFKGEGIVTPCFPQIVNITELAKDYGKTYKYEYVM